MKRQKKEKKKKIFAINVRKEKIEQYCTCIMAISHDSMPLH